MSAERVGLDYPALEAVMRMRRIPRGRWPEVFEDVQAMEAAALEEFNERAKRRPRSRR